MTTLVIRTDNMMNARKLSAMLKDVTYVKSVDVFNEPELSGSDWIKPGRAATNDEVKKLVNGMMAQEEAGKYYTGDEVKAKTFKKIKEWKKKSAK